MQPSQQETEPRDRLRPKILVTGATGTLGSAIVRALAVGQSLEESALRPQLVAHFHRNKDAAQRLRDETGCEIVQADVADEAQVGALFSHCDALFAVIHAAATAHDALLLRQTRDEWNTTLRVDADGAFLVTRAALRCLPHGGRLVLLASRVGEKGNAGQSAYAAAKAAVIALAKAAAREGAGQGIAVNALCPGVVPSALTRSLSGERLDELAGESVFGALGSTDDVVATVKWLLHPSLTVSGQVIHCHSRI
jgi:3-oxoacyl-[acyl-carrier protein] reductase